MKNAGWLFYRGYYHPIESTESADLLTNFVRAGKFFGSSEAEKKREKKFFEVVSRSLTDFAFEDRLNDCFIRGPYGFSLTTTYPGLLTGSGYSHQTGTLGEFKSGFFFDHATGLPLIPGSSVKGILRSAFPGQEKKKVKQTAKENFVKTLLGRIRIGLETTDVKQLEAQIFEGTDPKKGLLPMVEHDVFLDAYVEKTTNPNGRIFDEDYITPHGDNPLKDPVPVRFLKILPGVTFRFNFRLQPAEIGETVITADEKEKLFRLILGKFGAGAKTNVGYGQFE